MLVGSRRLRIMRNTKQIIRPIRGMKAGLKIWCRRVQSSPQPTMLLNILSLPLRAPQASPVVTRRRLPWGFPSSSHEMEIVRASGSRFRYDS